MKKLFAICLALALSLSLAACGSTASDTSAEETTEDTAAAETTETTDATETTVLKVAASPTPHAEILAQCVPILAEQGIDLQITEYGDYIVPNTAVEEGDEDANYFQHGPYLDQFNEENGTHIVSVAQVHYEPMGIYAGQCTSLDELPDGAVIAVPNDVTNEARALQLLAAQGIIELDENAGLNATPNDIVSNPKNVTFMEMEAAMLPQTLEEVSLSVINANYALQGGLSPATDALASESADSEAAQTYANILCVEEGNENNPAVQALVEALHSDTIRDYINDTYNGAVVPIF